MFHIRLNILPDDEVLVTLDPEVYAGSGEKEGGGSDAPEVNYTIAEAFSEIDGAGWSGERGEGVNREVGDSPFPTDESAAPFTGSRSKGVKLKGFLKAGSPP